MPTLEGSIRIRGAQDDLFDLTQDYRLRQAWDPFVRKMQFLHDAPRAALNVQVAVQAWTGLSMTVEFIRFSRPTIVAMKMIQGPFFFRLFAGSWRFEPKENGEGEVTFRYHFQTRWPWLGWLLNPIIGWVFQRDIRARLRGLKQGVEERRLLEQLGAECG
jgi:ribosome-associated toxin RatA of RatAB toxin-antitoxin module